MTVYEGVTQIANAWLLRDGFHDMSVKEWQVEYILKAAAALVDKWESRKDGTVSSPGNVH